MTFRSKVLARTSSSCEKPLFLAILANFTTSGRVFLTEMVIFLYADFHSKCNLYSERLPRVHFILNKTSKQKHTQKINQTLMVKVTKCWLWFFLKRDDCRHQRFKDRTLPRNEAKVQLTSFFSSRHFTFFCRCFFFAEKNVHKLKKKKIHLMNRLYEHYYQTIYHMINHNMPKLACKFL